MTIGSTRRLESLYVPVSDGVRGADGSTLLEAAIGDHQGNIDMRRS